MEKVYGLSTGEKAENSKLEVQLEEAYTKLYDSEKYLRAIVESSLDGIAVVDEQGTIEFGNDSLFKITGWPRDELIGKSFIKVLADDTKELHLKIWQEAQKNAAKTGTNAETRIVTKNGEIKYLYISRVEAIINGVRKFVFIAKDISEKKVLELKLKESEAKYRDLFENAEDPMYTHDLKGYLLTVNKIGLKILGGTEEEVIGSHISKWLMPESYRIFEERVRKIHSGEPLEEPVLIEVICKNGEHKWGEVRTRLIRDSDGIVGTHGICRDITEKKRLEEKIEEYQEQLEKSYVEVKKAEERYRDLFENANDSLYIYDSSGYFKEVNNTALKLLGCTREEIIGTHISEWITPESLKRTCENLKKRIVGEEPADEPFVLEVICKNGEHKCMEIRRRLIKNRGKLLAVHGIGRDITEKKKLEEKIKEYQEQLEKSYEEIKESEARYRELFENAIDAIYTQDLEGRILTMNSAGLKILGCTRDELIGTNFSKWLTPESLKIGREVLAKTLSGKIIKKPTVVEIICKSGEHRWVEFTIRPIKENDRTVGMHGIGRDVTENKRLRQELKDSNRQIKLLWYLMAETRGGNTRALILKRLTDKPYNANQLAGALGMDYKTIRHHLNILVKNGVVRKEDEGYSSIYFLPKAIRANLDNFNQIK